VIAVGKYDRLEFVFTGSAAERKEKRV